MGFDNYDAYLQSAHWIDLRRAYQESDLPQRCMCGSDEVQYHHRTYERLGAELLTDLMPLCGTCHRMVHELDRRGEMGLDFSGFEDAVRALQYRQATAPLRERARAEAPSPRIAVAKQQRLEFMRRKRRRSRERARLNRLKG